MIKWFRASLLDCSTMRDLTTLTFRIHLHDMITLLSFLISILVFWSSFDACRTTFILSKPGIS